MAAKRGRIIHGTDKGYQRCVKRTEGACAPCRDAHNAYMRAYRAGGEPKRKTRWWNRTRAAALEQLAGKHPREFTEILDGIRQREASPV